VRWIFAARSTSAPSGTDGATKHNDGYNLGQLRALPKPPSGRHNILAITHDTDQMQIGLPGSCDEYGGFFVSRWIDGKAVRYLIGLIPVSCAGQP
jgi:hypothetical protein